MKTVKKSLAVILAALTLMSTVAFGFSVSAIPKFNYLINRIDITLRTDIAGKSYWDYDYKEVYTVDSKHVGYPDDWSLPLRIYDEKGNFPDELIAGKTYQFRVYVEREQNAFFTSDMDVYVNGKKVSYYETEDDDVIRVECGSYKITNNKSINIFARFINWLKYTFKSIFGTKSEDWMV